jgi:hypothetical protein
VPVLLEHCKCISEYCPNVQRCPGTSQSSSLASSACSRSERERVKAKRDLLRVENYGEDKMVVKLKERFSRSTII